MKGLRWTLHKLCCELSSQPPSLPSLPTVELQQLQKPRRSGCCLPSLREGQAVSIQAAELMKRELLASFSCCLQRKSVSSDAVHSHCQLTSQDREWEPSLPANYVNSRGEEEKVHLACLLLKRRYPDSSSKPANLFCTNPTAGEEIFLDKPSASAWSGPTALVPRPTSPACSER